MNFITNNHENSGLDGLDDDLLSEEELKLEKAISAPVETTLGLNDIGNRRVTKVS